MVTSGDVAVNQLFVQDATEGMYIEISASALITNDVVALPSFVEQLTAAAGAETVSADLRSKFAAG